VSIVEFGKTTSYGQVVSVIDRYTTVHNVILNGLESNTLYHVRVSSLDEAGNGVSAADFTFSTEEVIDSEPPVFTSPPTVTALTNSTVTIAWTTNEPSSTKVNYGTESGYWGDYPSRARDLTRVIDHSITVTGLTGNTRYYFRAASADADINASISQESTFVTDEDPDILPPRITTTPTVVTISDTTATIVWDTDEPANSTIRYWDASWAESRTWENYQFTKSISVLVNRHTINLTNLTAETQYYFMVGSSDGSGNGPTTSNISSFVTEEAPDIIAPQFVSPPTVTAVTNKSVTIEWVSDEPSNSAVQYGEFTSEWDQYPKFYFDPEGVTSHRIVIAGLEGQTTYFLRVGGSDIFNNGPNTSPDDSNPSNEVVVMTQINPDSESPLITSPPTVTAKTDNVAVIEWSTNEPSNSMVQYDLTSNEWGAYPLSESIPDMVVNHSVVLANLGTNQTYYFRVGSVDEHGNGPEPSHEVFFTTDTEPDNTSPRIVLPPTVTGITDSIAIIEWKTDEPSNSVVKFQMEFESGGVPDLLWQDTSLTVASSNQMVTQHSVTLTNLSPGSRYYFIVGSTDAGENGPNSDDPESNNPFSQDSFFSGQTGDDAAPKILSGPIVSAKDNQSAIIEWETDEPSNSIVKYDTREGTWDELSYGFGDTIYDEECFENEDGSEDCYPIDENGKIIDENNAGSESDAELVTYHSVTITDLQPSTNYFFRVGSTDALGNGPYLNQDVTNPSDLAQVTTEEGPDGLAPSITSLRVFFVTNTTALIIWNTDEPSNSIIKYGVFNEDWDNYPFEEADAGMVTYHSITITGLQPDTLYYFRAGSTDAKGNGPWLNDDTQETNPSNEMTFRSAVGPDVTAPQISNFRATTTSDQVAVIDWTTDEPSNSQVRYDIESHSWQDYLFGENDAEMVTEHSVTVTGLSPSTLYYIRVSSTDASGNNYDTTFNDKNPSIEYNIVTSDADPPSIIVFPEVDSPKVDMVNNTIELTYDEPNMQNARLESNYTFSPPLTFADIENPINEISNTNGGSTYKLTLILIPEYTIFVLDVGEEITDADGHRVEPATVLINDNDNDGLPDDWEVAFGLDPTSTDDANGQGREGDFDGDGYSNYDEYTNRTNPVDRQDFPSVSVILQILPHDNAGVEDNFRVANNFSFAVLISDRNGINTNSDASVVFTVDDGNNDPYSIDLGDTDLVRVVKMNNEELDTAVTQLWAVYDRSRDGQYGGVFPFESTVNISVCLTNSLGDVAEKAYRFRVETEAKHNEASHPSNLPEHSTVEVDDPDLDDALLTYDTGFQVTYGDATGTKIIFNSSDVAPEIAPISELPFFYVPNATAVGGAINLQPPTIFGVPVKVIIPVSGDSDARRLSVYLYNGIEWVLGCDTSGVSGISGWMVPGSRRNDNGKIVFKVYHFSGIQTALLDVGAGADSRSGGDVTAPQEEVGSCFIGDLLDLKTGIVYGTLFITIILILGGGMIAVNKRKKTG